MENNNEELLMMTGFDTYVPVEPEDEKFHSIYISGADRENHKGITEKSGLLQIRGVNYNLNEVNMIIMHIKEIMVNKVNERGEDKTLCFSFKDSFPYKGINGKTCPAKREDRERDSFCKNCRSNIIVSGILTEPSGKPILDNNKKPIFGFIRASGMKYSNISEYLQKISLDTESQYKIYEDLRKERSIANPKKFVTKITASSSYSTHWKKNFSVFSLEIGTSIPKEVVEKLIKLQATTIQDFIDKFNWAKSQQFVNNTLNGANENSNDTDGIIKNMEPEKPQVQNTVQNNKSNLEDISFDDVPF